MFLQPHAQERHRAPPSGTSGRGLGRLSRVAPGLRPVLWNANYVVLRSDWNNQTWTRIPKLLHLPKPVSSPVRSGGHVCLWGGWWKSK